MRIILDGRPIEIEELAGDATIRNVIDAVKAQQLAPGRIIFGIACNGEAIRADRLEATLNGSVSQFENVALTSGSARDAVLEALEATRVSLSNSFPTVKEASEALAAGNVAVGMSKLVECIGVWASVHEAVVNGGPLLGIDFETLMIADRHILEWLKDLSDKLREIKEAVESRDMVSLGDILRYEVDDMLQGWEAMLVAFIEQVRSMEGAASAGSAP